MLSWAEGSACRIVPCHKLCNNRVLYNIRSGLSGIFSWRISKSQLILLPEMQSGEKFFSCVAGEFVVNHKILKKRKNNPKLISAVLD